MGFLVADLRGLFVGTFPVLDSEKEAYPILGINGLFGNGENLIRLISSYPFLQYVRIGPKSKKVEFQYRLNGSHGAAMRSMSTVGLGIPPKKEIVKKNKILFSQLVVLSALDITIIVYVTPIFCQLYIFKRMEMVLISPTTLVYLMICYFLMA